MKNKKIRFSLGFKFTVIFTAVLVLTIAAIAIANQILLSRLYKREKRESLMTAYKVINSFYSDNGESGELEIEKIYLTKDIAIYICSEDGEKIFSSSQNAEHTPPFFGDKDFARRHHDNGGEGMAEPPMKREPFAKLIPKPAPGAKYEVKEISDIRLGSSFIQLTARLDNGNFLYLRTPMAAVEEAADTANRLLIYIGLAAVLAGLLITVLAVRAVTKPIRELTAIAKDMAELDFGSRYTGKSRDEVGELGASFNLMSDKLENTIFQLRESNSKLEKDIELKNSVDKMRREFIADASHELKTPLALISGYAEGLRANIASSAEDKDFYCEVIADETAKMDKIIKQFLTITELDAMTEPEMTQIDLGAAVESSVRSFDILAKNRGLEIETDITCGVTVYGDEAALEQAVGNYITNALNHVDENKRIRVSVEKTAKGARVSVYNSGRNIPEAASERIWESFGKLDKARTRAYGGSGLGLAIVKKCVELHGGCCGFSNVEGGVEFFFEI